MKIMTNVRVSKMEQNSWRGDLRVYEESLIRKELLTKMVDHLMAYPDIFKKEEHKDEYGDNTEYRIELMVFTPSSIRETIHELRERYQIPLSAIQDLWSKLIKDL